MCDQHPAKMYLMKCLNRRIELRTSSRASHSDQCGIGGCLNQQAVCSCAWSICVNFSLVCASMWSGILSLCYCPLPTHFSRTHQQGPFSSLLFCMWNCMLLLLVVSPVTNRENLLVLIEDESEPAKKMKPLRWFWHPLKIVRSCFLTTSGELLTGKTTQRGLSCHVLHVLQHDMHA